PPLCGTHKSRASEGTLTKDPLSAPKKGAVLPLSGEEITAEIVETPVTAFLAVIDRLVFRGVTGIREKAPKRRSQLPLGRLNRRRG
ncbi:MAG TPA: hypothetical protein VN754_11330, partial [Candidatus Binataceae bacterium]|nr:hypothetical protein [Candidatus Binataceae bacterium]